MVIHRIASARWGDRLGSSATPSCIGLRAVCLCLQSISRGGLILVIRLQVLIPAITVLSCFFPPIRPAWHLHVDLSKNQGCLQFISIATTIYWFHMLTRLSFVAAVLWYPGYWLHSRIEYTRPYLLLLLRLRNHSYCSDLSWPCYALFGLLLCCFPLHLHGRCIVEVPFFGTCGWCIVDSLSPGQSTDATW